jgi:ankyrin repeat protein
MKQNHMLEYDYKHFLATAAYTGNISLVKTLLERGMQVNGISHYFGTPLQAAAAGGFNNVVLLLLERGADINEASAPSHFSAYQVEGGYWAILLKRTSPIAERRGLLKFPRDALNRTLPPGPRWKVLFWVRGSVQFAVQNIGGRKPNPKKSLKGCAAGPGRNRDETLCKNEKEVRNVSIASAKHQKVGTSGEPDQEKLTRKIRPNL